jgi:hypothetical protein
MPFDLSLPLFATFSLMLGAVVTYFGWPHIRMRTYNKTHGNLRVIEIAFILSPTRARQPAKSSRRGAHGSTAPGQAEGSSSGAEFVIYMTLKAGNL